VKVPAGGAHHGDEPGGRSLAYLIAGQRFEAGTPRFAEAVAAAHAARQRPRCLCLVEGAEMYIARLAGSDEGYVVKRMPGTGSQHAPDCPSYEPPPEASGLGQVLGSAISEDPATGETTLKLDFPLSKIAGRSAVPAAAGGDSDSLASSGTRLSLRGLLHYLWDQAELTRWHTGFAGRRNWGTVRSHLLRAAEHKIARGDALRSRLYVPEPFSVDVRDAINARRLAQWQHAVAAPGRPQHLMLLIGEVKEIVPARYGYRCVIKHVPDQGFAIDEPLYRRLGRRFNAELALWGSADSVHVVTIATFGVSEAGIPAIAEMSLMPVTPQWLPVEDSFERQLVERLVAEGRSFIKGLRYNLPRDQRVATATLTDMSHPGPLLFIVPAGLDGAAESEGLRELLAQCEPRAWTWRPASEVMPQLPAPARRDRKLCTPVVTAAGP
jgi:hypothetical protein